MVTPAGCSNILASPGMISKQNQPTRPNTVFVREASSVQYCTKQREGWMMAVVVVAAARIIFPREANRSEACAG